jgi:hypothetical protein
LNCSTCKDGACATPDACASEAGAAPRLPKTYRPVILDGPYSRKHMRVPRPRVPPLVRGALLVALLLMLAGALFR